VAAAGIINFSVGYFFKEKGKTVVCHKEKTFVTYLVVATMLYAAIGSMNFTGDSFRRGYFFMGRKPL